MNSIYIFLAIVMLGYTANAQTTQQGKPASKVKKTSIAAKTNVAPTASGKPEYVDFDVEVKDAATTKSRKLMVSELLNSMKHKKITGYDGRVQYDSTGNNIFSKPIAYKPMTEWLRERDYVDVISKDGDKLGTNITLGNFHNERITGYRVKQQIMTDKQTGTTRANISALALTTYIKLSNGDTIMAHSPVCWLKYSQCKSAALANKKFDAAAWDALFVGGKVKGI